MCILRVKRSRRKRQEAPLTHVHFSNQHEELHNTHRQTAEKEGERLQKTHVEDKLKGIVFM